MGDNGAPIAFVERISKGGAAASLAGLADAVKPFQSSGGAQPSKPAREPRPAAKPNEVVPGSRWSDGVCEPVTVEEVDYADDWVRYDSRPPGLELTASIGEFLRTYPVKVLTLSTDADDDDGMAAYLAQKFGQRKDNERVSPPAESHRDADPLDFGNDEPERS